MEQGNGKQRWRWRSSREYTDNIERERERVNINTEDYITMQQLQQNMLCEHLIYKALDSSHKGSGPT